MRVPPTRARQAAPCAAAAAAGSGTPPTGPPPPPADTTAPGLGNVVISKGRLLFTASENATILVRITQLLDGRRRGKRCVAPSRKTVKARHCTRRGRATTLQGVAATAGAGRASLGTGLLRKGRYEVAVTARDAAGNVSTPILRQLTVKR